MAKVNQRAKLNKVSGQQIFSSFLAGKKKKTLIFSGIAGVVIMITAFQVFQFTENAAIRDIGIISGILAMILPISMQQIKENRRRDSIDSNLPIFLLAILSSIQSGSSLLRAIEEAADRNMGSLTPELRNLRANISWGMPYGEAFDNFTSKVGTRLARRVGILLEIAMDVGGNVASTIELIQTHTSEMQNIEKERKSELSPYIYTIYISFVVFIAITVILVANFFTEIEVVQAQLRESAKASGTGLGMFGALLGVKVSELTAIMFNLSLIEAVFGGLAAGKIGEGSFVAGIKHIIIMVVIAVLAFTFMGAI